MRRITRTSLMALTAMSLAACQTTDLQQYNPFASESDKFQGRYMDHVIANPPEPGGGIGLGSKFFAMFESDDDKSVKQTGAQDGLTINRMLRDGTIEIGELNMYLDAMADKLLLGWQGDKPEISIHLEPSWDTNARAYPDGSIFIPLGLLYELETRDAVAALVAHEISHVLLKHHPNNYFNKVQKKAYGAVSLSIGVISAVNQIQSSMGKQQQTNQEELVKAFVINVLADKLANDVIDPGWTRDAEDAADFLGMDLVLAAGYSADGFQKLFDVLEKVAELEKEKNRQKEVEYEALVNQQMEQGQVGQAMNVALTGAVSELGQEFGELWDDHISADHRPADERATQVFNYIDAAYEGSPVLDVMTDETSFAYLLNSPSVLSIKNNLGNAVDTLSLTRQGDFVDADKKSLLALKGPVSDSPYVRLTLYEAERERGRVKKAMGHYDSMLSLPGKGLATYRYYQTGVDAYLQVGEIDKAAKLADRAVADFGDVDYLLPMRLDVYRAQKKQGHVVELSARCQLTGENKLIEKCASPEERKKRQEAKEKSAFAKLFN